MLQQKLFPIYFAITTTLTVILPFTYPAVPGTSIKSGAAGVLASDNKWKVLVPLATIFVASVLNMVWFGPATTRVMKERKRQGVLFILFWWS